MVDTFLKYKKKRKEEASNLKFLSSMVSTKAVPQGQANTFFKQKVNQQTFNRLLLKFVVSHLHTLSIIREPKFMDLFRYVASSVKIISRRQLGRLIDKTGDSVEVGLKK